MAMTLEELGRGRGVNALAARARRRATRPSAQIAWGRVMALIFCTASWTAAGFGIHALLG